jgi:hypothetical protein
MKVKYLGDSLSCSGGLSVGKVYEVVGIEADYFRLLNDTWDPCLYNPECFWVVDSSEPAFWVSSLGEDGERYAYPECWFEVGFFEDFHDKISEVVERFWKDYARLYAHCPQNPAVNHHNR